MLKADFDHSSPMPYIWNAALNLNRPAPQPRSSNVQDADYHYHKQVADELTNALRSAGAIIVVEVDLTAINGLTARADFMGMLPQYGGVVMTELKTSLKYDDYGEFESGTSGASRLMSSAWFPWVAMSRHPIARSLS